MSSESPYASVWTEPFRIRAYEGGPDERASLLTVCNLFQEAAGEQARANGLEAFPLPGGSVSTWVLSRLRVAVVGALPRARDAVTVDTWPSDREGLRVQRDFVRRGAAGEALVRATSVWFLLDVERRRPVRLPEAMDRFLPPPGVPRALTFSGHPPPVAPEPSASSGGALARTERFRVRHADLDRVGHANHVRVAEWVLEAVPESVRAEQEISGLDVAFQSEATPGQTVVSSCRPDPGGAGRTLDHIVTREADGRTVALARTQWS